MAFILELVGVLMHIFVILKNARIGSLASSMMQDKTEMNSIVSSQIDKYSTPMSKLGFYYYYDSNSIRIFIMPLDPNLIPND